MSDIVIKAESLGKKYTIGHQANSERYTALRDVMMRSASSLWRKTKDLVRGKPIIQGDSTEEIWALKDVSFEIRRGEAVGIIGRNGAGKSTLLKVLSRITEPSAGRVTIKGRVASLLEVGTGFHPELTGRENIYLNGAILGMTRWEIKTKFDEIVDFAEVEKFLDTPVKRYSSGMYVRLAFSVAAHLSAEILLIDEVLAVGDLEFQKKCIGKMNDVARGGRTILFVSHNLAAVKRLCSNAFLLNDGKSIRSGDPNEVVSFYASLSANDTNSKSMKWVRGERELPFSETLQVNRFYVLENGSNIDGSILGNSRSYDAVVEINLLQNDPRLIFFLAYYSEDDEILFTTDIHDTGGVNFAEIAPGGFRLSVPIPTELFWNGRFGLELCCALHHTGWILQPGNPSRMDFQYFRDVDLNPYSNETRLGRLAPVIKWQVNKMDTEP